MFGDTQVLRINFDENKYDIISEKHIPYGLKGRIKEVPDFTECKTKYEQTQAMRAAIDNYKAVAHWLADRTLLLSRANAKWIYNALNIEQKVDDETRLKIAIICRAVSVMDKYWLKLDGENKSWSNIDIKRNPLNEIIAQIALHGKSLTIQGSLTSPELTTHGAYAKAWRRHDDNNLWLYKLGHDGDSESRIEIMVSDILDRCNVDHVKYIPGTDDDKFVCMCPCISTDELSLISASDYIAYCNVNGIDYKSEVLRIGADDFYKMHIVDYLISNRDRHDENWGFFMDNSTMTVTALHPLFDHNNAFDLEYMRDKDARYQCTGKSLRESAKYAMSKTDFHFTDDITRDLFITERQYKSFMERANELGIKVVRDAVNPFISAADKMSK